eukprot:m.1121655 g.1121655  ORF g.1121655 m.1121655 type:complete len:254 (-) comp24399_c0_seq10:134-895(-)
MYLLEAKKRAEKEFKEQQKKEKEEARRKARKERYEQKGQVKATKAEKKSSARSGGQERVSGAVEAQRALEAAQARQKAKEDAEMAEAIRKSKEEARQRQNREMRQALGGASGGDVAGQARITSKPAADLVFQAIPTQNDDGTDWTDMSIKCFYVGTFEAGEAERVDKKAVKEGIHSMKDYITGQRAAILIICLEGLKVVDTTSNKVAMAHALNRVYVVTSHAPERSVATVVWSGAPSKLSVEITFHVARGGDK